jgi:protein SCO1/2
MRKPTRKLRATPEKEGQIMKRTNLNGLAAIIALLGFGGAALGHDVNHQGRPPVQVDASRVAVRVVDRPVVDQDGITRSFGKDVVGDHLVVMDFIYTDCGTLCPLQSAILADLQDKLGDRLGRDVAFVSISVDPVVDQPDRLHEEAVRFDAKPGWHFLTGQPKDIEVILTGLQAWVETPEDHPGFFLVGSADQNDWSKLDGLPSPDQLMQRINAATLSRARQR